MREADDVGSAEGLTGRDAECAAVSAALRQVRSGRACSLAVQGEAGIGKTRLVTHLLDEATRLGLDVRSGRAHPFERTRPFGAVAEALDLSRRSTDVRRASIGALLAGEPGVGTSSDDPEFRVVEEIVDLVEVSSNERPLVLVVEDVQWADSGSLLVLSSLARRLPFSAVLIVVTMQSPIATPSVGRVLDDLAAADGLVLTLSPLQPEQVVELATQRLGASPGRGLTDLLSRAGGNPLWVTAMLDSLAGQGLLRPADGTVETSVTELPTSVNELVVRRLGHLPLPTLELLRVTAVLGDAVTLRDVVAVARRDAREVVTDLGPAFEAQLLDESEDGLVFRHQVVHDAIYQQIPTAARRLLHRQAATALMAAGESRLRVADHLMLGAERGDEDAISWLRDAARETAPRAPATAVDLLRRAETLLPDEHPEADLLWTEGIQAMLRAGHAVEVSTRAEAILARPHPPMLDTPLRLAQLGALALQNRASEVLEAARAGLGSSALSPEEQVPMLAQESWALTYLGDLVAGEDAARRALLVAEQSAVPAISVWALAALEVAVGRQGRFTEALDHAVRAVHLAEAAGPEPLPLQPRLFLGLALFDCDQVLEARRAYRGALADEFGSWWWRSDTLMADAQVDFVVGDWADAVPSLVAGGEAAEEKGHALLVTQSLALRALIAAGIGDHLGARELCASLDRAPRPEGRRFNSGVVASAVAAERLATGDRKGAYEVLLDAWNEDLAYGDRFYVRSLAPSLTRLALAMGHDDVATAVTASTVDAGLRAPGIATVAAASLRCEAMLTGDAEKALEAVELVRRTPLLVDLAGACEDAAAVAARAGRADLAATLLTDALESYEHAGAEAWASRVRAGLRDLGVHRGSRGPRHRPATGWQSLTATERSVSLLVADGLTNGAVARRLYISPHTVNTHLRHVFSKMGVSNRVALATVVHRTIE